MGEVCSAGSCGIECLGGSTKCGNFCVDTNNDPSNCGTCSNTCASGEVCSSGSCLLQCPAGQTNCSGTCTNTDYDPNNCGSCANVCTGACTAGTCGSGWQFVGVGNSTYAGTVSSTPIGTLPLGATKVAFGVWAAESEDYNVTGDQGNYTMTLGAASCTRSDAPWSSVEGECIVVLNTAVDFLYDNNYPNSTISECDISFTASSGVIAFADTSSSEDCGYAVYAYVP